MSRKCTFIYKLFVNSFILLLFSLYLRFSKTIRLMKELSKQTTTEVSVVLNRSIFFFYEKALRYVPILLMLCHWYGVYSFHDNPREILIDIRENEECIAYLYFMVYIFPVVFMLPASHFFKLCWIWRIPFVYIIGTNTIRLYYGSWFITNEMYDADFILILMTLALYVCAFVQVTCRTFRHNRTSNTKTK